MNRIEACKDGSHTLYSEKFGQFYHNPNGAVAESIHVFFESSGILTALSRNEPVHVLEIGFGTGLNALLLADFKLKLGSRSPVIFQSTEAFPISPEVAGNLNYNAFLHHPELLAHWVPLFSALQHDSVTYPLLKDMELRVFRGQVDEFTFPKAVCTHIFHDPFSPEVNPELWTSDLFEQIRHASTEEAVLVTYCAATKARGAMAVGGWKVARAPGALGKREMTIASLDERRLEGLRRLDESRLIQRFSRQDQP